MYNYLSDIVKPITSITSMFYNKDSQTISERIQPTENKIRTISKSTQTTNATLQNIQIELKDMKIEINKLKKDINNIKQEQRKTIFDRICSCIKNIKNFICNTIQRIYYYMFTKHWEVRFL